MAKVLIVERDDAAREAWRYVLADAGYDVMEAVSVAIALRMLSAARQPVVALFDHLALDASSHNALRAIANDERLARRHTYAVLAPNPHTISSALQPVLMTLGADIIQRPVSDDALPRMVALALERAEGNHSPIPRSPQGQLSRKARRPALSLDQATV